jgi:hypothetical protein
MRKTHRAGFSPAMERLARSPETRDRELIITIAPPPRESAPISIYHEYFFIPFRCVVERVRVKGESVVKRGRIPYVTVVVVDAEDF